MVKNNLINLIPAMQLKLNKIIEENKFNLQSKKVLSFSIKLNQILNYHETYPRKSLQQINKQYTDSNYII